MKRTKYTAEFKSEAVKQILEKGHSATDVASRLGVPVGLLYTWTRKLKGLDEKPIEDVKALQVEMTKLKAELRRTTEERDILKKAAAYFAKVSIEVVAIQRASPRVPAFEHVPSSKGAPQWLLRLAQGAPVTPGSGERQVIRADPLLLRSKYGDLWQPTDLP